jgi:GT2 family glycosyltransferase
MAAYPSISVVVITLNEGARLRETVEGLRSTLPRDAELVIVDDGSTDGSTEFLAAPDEPAILLRSTGLGTARARNWGARQSHGEFIVFADAHVKLPAGWWEPMVELLKRQLVGAVAPMVSDFADSRASGYGLRLAGPDLTAEWLPSQGLKPYPVPLLPGCCLAMRREVFQAVGGFDDGLLRWGGMEHELGLRLWLLGYELWLTPEVECAHLFRDEGPYHVEWSWVIHNRLRLAFLHFNRSRIAHVVENLRDHEGFSDAVALLADSDVSSRRCELASRRTRDAEWYFETFGPKW